jgi:hypothetical protein
VVHFGNQPAQIAAQVLDRVVDESLLAGKGLEGASKSPSPRALMQAMAFSSP